MYKFKKIFIFIKEVRVDATDILASVRVNSYEDAQSFLVKEGFEYFMYILEEVNK